MIGREAADIFARNRSQGWILEPETKYLLSQAGLPVPRYVWARDRETALDFAAETGYPVVAKVVSAEIMHKTDRGGVVTGIADPGQLQEVFGRLQRLPGFDGILVEEMLAGLELLVGGRIDFQFGPVVLLGMGGVRAEIYRDVALHMAPLDEAAVVGMIKKLRARQLLEGYRGADPVNMDELSRLVALFSRLLMEWESFVDSVDLNPVMCSKEKCFIADARIILKKN